MSKSLKELPPAILTQHIAVLGKTGSGKTSTAKLAIEQVVAGGARVCVLDPIKSDWWGLTSSRNGKHEGLPFHILGGPHGHVPLHASAGKAVAEIVATGQLPLSIIDMTDFEPGGQSKFFVDFVPTLLRKMRGVVYLVLEEAHLFAPKERSGIGAENLSIHWAKTMATAGRSKGVRLVLVTQRTQALHNALLGSCDTLIAHRLTAPADQEPVVKWLKANTSKAILDQVSSSLSSLKTGEGWICSGEAKIFEAVQFDRISTYDNTATPTGDGAVRDVKTATVDQDKLRAIIGTAIEQAKADDPRELKKRIAELERQVKMPAPAAAAVPGKTVEILTDADRALCAKVLEEVAIVRDILLQPIVTEKLETAVAAIVAREVQLLEARRDGTRERFVAAFNGARVQKLIEKLERVAVAPSSVRATACSMPANPATRVALGQVATAAALMPPSGAVPPGQQRILDVLAMLGVRGVARSIDSLSSWMDLHPNGGTFRGNLAALRNAGYLADYELTDSGKAAARQMPSGLDTAKAAVDGGQLRIIETLEPRQVGLSVEELGAALTLHPNGGTFRGNLARLRKMGLITSGAIKLTEAAYR